jgi:hypothetical protein
MMDDQQTSKNILVSVPFPSYEVNGTLLAYLAPTENKRYGRDGFIM